VTYHFFRGIGYSTTMETLLIGTSWGDIIMEKLIGPPELIESYEPKPSLIGHKAPITFILTDEK